MLRIRKLSYNALKRQCLPERIADIVLMHKMAAAWNRERNTGQYPGNWQFATCDTRVKLKRLYRIF